MDYFWTLVWIEYAEGQAWKHESWNVFGKHVGRIFDMYMKKCDGKILGMYMKERIGYVGTVQSLEDTAYGRQWEEAVTIWGKERSMCQTF